MLKATKLLTIIFILVPALLIAQGDMMDLLDEQPEESTQYAIATFKATRIINSHSVAMPAPGEMQFTISHRFGRVDEGWRKFFGIDQAFMRLGMEFGIRDWLSAGFGRSNLQGTFDFYARAKLLKQSKGVKKMPITAVWKSEITIYSQESGPEQDIDVASRLGYVHQLLIARKFHEYFSFQIMPTFVHKNLVDFRGERNNIWAIGFGASIKATRSLNINIEYFQPIPGEETFSTDISGDITKYRGTLSLSIDIETGGHVFQVILATNSVGMIEQQFIGESLGYWWDGDIHFGFNINRMIDLKGDKSSKKSKKSSKKGGADNSTTAL